MRDFQLFAAFRSRETTVKTRSHTYLGNRDGGGGAEGLGQESTEGKGKLEEVSKLKIFTNRKGQIDRSFEWRGKAKRDV